MPMFTGIATIVILEAYVIGEAPSQPMSTTLNDKPNFSDICAA